MTILIDVGEKKPLEFNHSYIDSIETINIDTGDYGARFNDGYTPLIYFERKSLPDLFGTLTHGYERFRKEIKRAKDNGIQLHIIIEGSFTKVLFGIEHSQRPGISVIKQLFTIWVEYGVFPIFCKNREEMAQYITEYFIAVGKDRLKQKKEDKNVDK